MPHRDEHQLGPLLERVRRGEAEARNALLGRLRPYLQALIRSWLGPELAGQLADSDVVQETLLRIDRGLAGFRGQDVPALLGWVRQIAHRAAVDRRRQAGLPVLGGEAPLSEVADPGTSPPEAAERAEQVLRLTAALQQLSEPRRAVIQARLFEGLSYAALARRLGGSEGALRVLFTRALEQLRGLLEEEP